MNTIKALSVVLLSLSIGCGTGSDAGTAGGSSGSSGGQCCTSGSSGGGGGTSTQGPTGPQGPAGPQGAPGLQGPIGETGATGPAGPQGPAGPTGAQGPAGATGPTGPVGAQGPAGPQGPAGTIASTSEYVVSAGVQTTGGSAAAIASCKSPKDLLLGGTCTSSYTGFYVQPEIVLGNGTTSVSSWQCSAQSGVSPEPFVYAVALCLTP
jgi:hypothetical protein